MKTSLNYSRCVRCFKDQDPPRRATCSDAHPDRHLAHCSAAPATGLRVHVRRCRLVCETHTQQFSLLARKCPGGEPLYTTHSRGGYFSWKPHFDFLYFRDSTQTTLFDVALSLQEFDALNRILLLSNQWRHCIILGSPWLGNAGQARRRLSARKVEELAVLQPASYSYVTPLNEHFSTCPEP